LDLFWVALDLLFDPNSPLSSCHQPELPNPSVLKGLVALTHRFNRTAFIYHFFSGDCCFIFSFPTNLLLFSFSSLCKKSMTSPGTAVNSVDADGSAGSCRLFWIPLAVSPSSFFLESKLIYRRTAPADVVGNADFGYASIFFIESRNLHHVPSQFKGTCCAVLLSDASSSLRPKWRLCYVWKVDAERDCMQVFIWRGCLNSHTADSAVPTFFSHSTFDLDGLRQHFKFASLRSSEQQVVFLNQVAGFRPFGQASLFSAVNVVDGRFQCNVEGPDVWTFPPEAKSIAQSILPTFRPDFLTSALSHFDFSDAGRKEYDWGPFRPPSVLPLLPMDRKSKKHRPMKSPSWTSPPKVFTFSGGALCYNLVYVEDTSCRLPPQQASNRGLVAMPILVATRK
jgi:hypothetical protein